MSFSLRPLARARCFLASLFEPNPVFRRELRARWRRMAAFLTLFFYVAPLALAMTELYANAVPTAYNDASSGLNVDSVGPQLASIGRALFESLILMQVVAWLLIAPATAAPAIAAERERGLLEALHLTNLPARRVVFGKYLAALAFLALLMLVPLPIVAICFFFGGLSPWEFAQAVAIIALSAICGTALGLYFSSRRHRPAAALRDTFMVLALWSVLSVCPESDLPVFNSLPLPGRQALAVVQLTHPFHAATTLLHDGNWAWPLRDESEDYIPPMPLVYTGLMTAATAPPPAVMVFDAPSAWVMHLSLQAALALLFLLGAVRATGRPLKEPLWVERRQWVDRLRARWEARGEAARTDERRLKHRAQTALVREIPLLSRRSFNNPVFGREMRGKLRWRGAAPWLWLLRIVAIAVPLLIYIQALADALEGVQPDAAWQRFTWLGMAGLALYAGVSGAGGFTRERERGTWEGLKLTLLQPGQILRGKVMPIVLMAAMLSLPLWPALFCCIRPNFGDWKFFDFSVPHEAGLTLWHLTIAAGIIMGTTFFAACTALFLSWISRRTPVAVGLTVVTLPVLLLAPAINTSFAYLPNDDRFFNARLMAAWSPPVAMLALTQGWPQLMMNPVPYPPNSSYVPGRGWVALTQEQMAQEQKKYEARLATARAAAQIELEEKLALHRDLLWHSALCPLTLLVLGSGELLLLCLLMRQKFREEK